MLVLNPSLYEEETVQFLPFINSNFEYFEVILMSSISFIITVQLYVSTVSKPDFFD